MNVLNYYFYFIVTRSPVQDVCGVRGNCLIDTL